MSRTIYVNGCYQTYNNALLHVEDRATLFADAVYEVIEIKEGKQVDQNAHLKRLERSLKEIRLETDFSLNTIPFIIRESIRRNRVKNGFVYIQISRGAGKRDFIFPSETTPATLIICHSAPGHRPYSILRSEIRGEEKQKSDRYDETGQEGDFLNVFVGIERPARH